MARKMNASDVLGDDMLLSQPPSIIDLLASLYEAGIYAKQTIKHTLKARYLHRSYEIYLFGNPGGVEPYRIDSATRGMSCSEMYQAWRKSVLDTMRNPDVPKYFMLKFAASPDVLIEQCFKDTSRDKQLKKALASFDCALEALLDVIKNMPQPTAPAAAQKRALAPPLTQAALLHMLRADMEDRRLVIYAGEYKLVSKHRLVYNGNPHRLLRSMVTNKGQELTNEKVGLPNSLKISNVVQGIGFKGLVHRKLLDCGYHTVTLRGSAFISDQELRELLEACQDTFDTQ